MRYFALETDCQYKWVYFPNKADRRFLTELNLQNPVSVPKEMKIEWNEEMPGKKWADFHEFSPTVLVLSKRASSVLDSFLCPNGFTVLTYGLKSRYLVFNVTTVLEEAFDWEQSDIKGDKSHLSLINTAALKTTKLKNSHIFKIAESSVDFFVSEDFKNKVEACNLTGFSFKDVILT